MKNYKLNGRMIALLAVAAISASSHMYGSRGEIKKSSAKKEKVLVDGNFAHMTVSSGFNADIIANGVGPLSSSVTNDADGFDYAFISKGLQINEADVPITFGLPADGLITNITSPHTYQLASYAGNNTLRLTDSGDEGTLQFSNPQTLERLYLLVTSGNGADISGTIHFSDGTTQAIGSYTVPGWFSDTGLPLVATGLGRGKIDSNQLDDFGNAPNLFQVEVFITEENQSKMVSGVTVVKDNGVTVFNLLGATGLVLTAAPSNSAFLAISSGFNADIIANGIGSLESSTTNDADGVDYVFISKGLQLTETDDPITFGLPEDGLIDNIAVGPNYQLALYTGNNALRLSELDEEGTVAFSNVQAVEAVYLLVTSSNGTDISVSLNFADDTSQAAETFSVPGWFSNTGLDIVAMGIGRGNLTTGQLDNFGNAPNFFQVVVPVTAENQSKDIESITIVKGTEDSIFNLMAVSALTTALGTAEQSFGKTAAYPNPVSNLLTIEMAGSSIDKVQVYNISGQLLKEQAGNLGQVSFSGFANGVYFVKLLSASSAVKTIKIVKN